MFKKFFANSGPFRVSPGWLTISYILLAIWTVIALFPLYWLLTTAFKAPADVDNGPKFIPWVDFQPTTAAWDYLLNDPSAANIIAPPPLHPDVVGTTNALISPALGASAAVPFLRVEFV